MELKYIVKKEDNYTNINQILKKEFEISNRFHTKLINSHKIFLNGQCVDTRNGIKPNDIITVNLDFEEESENIIATKMELNIIYEDAGLLILNKPAGIAVHPSILHYEDSLSNGVKYYFNSIGLKRKIRPVNRIDLNTSGIVIFAKCEYVQECLIKQMKEGQFKKVYLAIANGIFDLKQGTINLPIARKENSIIERCIDENGQISITHYKVLKEDFVNNFSVVECTLETGRTHQIRVHFSAIGHSLLGDSLYGDSSNLISRQALHSWKVCFVNPITKKKNTFECALPEDFEGFI
jgi:23S rRNA pseudouridine1911/1915/1917 synthase